MRLDTHVGGGGEDDRRAEAGGREGPEEVASVGDLVCMQCKESSETGGNKTARESGRWTSGGGQGTVVVVG